MRMDAFEDITSLRIGLQGEGLPGHGLALALGASNRCSQPQASVASKASPP